MKLKKIKQYDFFGEPILPGDYIMCNGDWQDGFLIAKVNHVTLKGVNFSKILHFKEKRKVKKHWVRNSAVVVITPDQVEAYKIEYAARKLRGDAE